MLTSVTSHLLLLKFIHFYCSNHVAWCPLFCFTLNLVARHLVATSHGLAETHCEGSTDTKRSEFVSGAFGKTLGMFLPWKE